MLPDFRSKDGLYRKKDKRFNGYKPEYLLSYDCLSRKPKVFFDYFRRNLDCRSIEPNAAHRKDFNFWTICPEVEKTRSYSFGGCRWMILMW